MFRNTKSRLPIIVFCLLCLCLVAAYARQEPQKNSTGEKSPDSKSDSKTDPKSAAKPGPTILPRPPKPGQNHVPASIKESITDQKDDDPTKPIRMDTDLVSLTVTVIDPYNRLVTGLDKQHFEIY